MSTKIYGASDDLIKFEGDVVGEANFIGEDEESCLVVCDDGTILAVQYGKPSGGIWRIDLLKQGPLFDRIDVCNNEDSDPYSDVAHFKDGLKQIWACESWEIVH